MTKTNSSFCVCWARSSVQVSLVFLPAHDIAKYVSEGNVDMGITGQDVIAGPHDMIHMNIHANTTK